MDTQGVRSTTSKKGSRPKKPTQSQKMKSTVSSVNKSVKVSKSSSSNKPGDIMKELAELKLLIKSVAEKYPAETKVILPLHTIVLPPTLDSVEAQKQTKRVQTECKRQFEAGNKKEATSQTTTSPPNQKL